MFHRAIAAFVEVGGGSKPQLKSYELPHPPQTAIFLIKKRAHNER